MDGYKKKEAESIIRSLLDLVYSNPTSPYAEKQAILARRVALKFKLRQPYELKLLFCKRCKAYSPPIYGKTVRVRRGRIIYTCLRCGKKYRLIFKP